jgi:hypothetical protein
LVFFVGLAVGFVDGSLPKLGDHFKEEYRTLDIIMTMTKFSHLTTVFLVKSKSLSKNEGLRDLVVSRSIKLILKIKLKMNEGQSFSFLSFSSHNYPSLTFHEM